MTVLAVVQARMGSSRLPGKVLMDFAGEPVLGVILKRLGQSNVDRVVVATSDSPIDDPIDEFATKMGIDVVRGSETDVLARYVAAMDVFPSDHIVRITGDCPFVDPALVDEAVAAHLATGAAYTSNTLVRTYPDGLDVEVIQTHALRTANDEARRQDEREHVTPFLYRRPARFRLHQFVTQRNLGRERWTLDTPADWDNLSSLARSVHNLIDASWLEILAIAGERAVLDDVDVIPDLGRSRAADRWWVVIADGQPAGSARVVAENGEATIELAVDESVASQARAAVERALEADCQVVTLAAAER